MDEHRITGTARQVGGKIEEGPGRATGERASQVRGVFDQAQGSAERLYGEAKEAASETAQGVRAAAVSLEDIIRTTIEQRPYTAAAVALGIGWLLGRTHRPL